MKPAHWFLLFSLLARSGAASSSETAEGILRQAGYFADRYQWGKALPLYEEAEQRFAQAGDRARAAYARLGRIRASVKDQSPERIYDALNTEIRRAPLMGDPSLRLRALFLKADVETDVDAISVRPFNAKQRRRDWEEILASSATGTSRPGPRGSLAWCGSWKATRLARTKSGRRFGRQRMPAT